MLPYAPIAAIFLPMIAAVLSPALSRFRRLRDLIEVSSTLTAAILASSMIPDVLQGYLSVNGEKHIIPFDWVISSWIPMKGVEFGIIIDSLSVFMANVVAWISFLIMVYSLEYMKHEDGLTRYWFFMNLFVGFMLLIVLSDNFLTLYVGWEGVGLCSYALIGFWYRDQKKYWIGSYSPTHCGLKAFITTRIGDIGLLSSILIIYIYSGTFNYLSLQQSSVWIENLARNGLFLVSMLLMLSGPIGKSAQFPLHVWLPEAMAGPTTVSALIHAATMVKAGVYLVARMTLILHTLQVGASWAATQLPIFFTLVVGIGAVTAFISATMGMVSDQIKKVLAYSTISQLGYMFVAFGAAGLTGLRSETLFSTGFLAGVYHLMNHAVFKALLFLAAGAIGHAIGSYLFKDMGGLRRRMPVTYLTMLFGALALSGIPPFSGFWSKEVIFHATFSTGNLLLSAVIVLTALLTVFYTFRMIGLAFFGEPSETAEGKMEEIRDPGLAMRVPLIILAIGCVLTGFMQPLIHRFFSSALSLRPEVGAGFFIEELSSPTLPVTLTLIGIGLYLTNLFYISRKKSYFEFVEQRSYLKAVWSFLYNRWYINDVYYKILVDGAYAVSVGLFKGLEARGLGELTRNLTVKTCNALRRIQTGYLPLNLLYVILGIIAILIILMGV